MGDTKSADRLRLAKSGFDPCHGARTGFSCHLDGQKLPFWVSFKVRFHLMVCPPCRRLHRSLDATRDALGALRDAEIASDDERIP
jgi:hypothetical protein